MRLICDEIAKRDVLDKLGIVSTIHAKHTLQGYECVHCENDLFYLEPTDSDTQHQFLVLNISDENIWNLDKFQSSIGLAKWFVTIDADTLTDYVPEDEAEQPQEEALFAYVRRNDETTLGNCVDLENIAYYKKKNPQLSTCDLYLLIPGKISKHANNWDNLPQLHSQVFDIFQKNIDQCVKEEYNSTFAQSLDRKCIAEVVLQLTDPHDSNRVCRQNALVGIVKHETGFCILEIIIQNCVLGGTKILNHFCGNTLLIDGAGDPCTIQEYCDKLHIRRFGRKRSMVFAYSHVTDEEIINALANEEFPMGTIGGDFLKKVEADNIAQYDTAEVYVSHETMLEKCKTMNVIGDDRLLYHVIEIFFVELILFQDAAIDKVYVDLSNEGEQQRHYRDPKAATERYEQLSFDMAQANRFGDYEQFNFPTVRRSAKKVAERFGINFIYEKYETNKELLASMIAANKRRTQERQDAVKNHFLLLLSALAAVGTLGDILHAIYEDRIGGLISYAAALVIIAGMFAIYKLISFIVGLVVKHFFKRESEEE